MIVPPSVNISSVELASISEIQDEKQNHQQKIQHSASTDTFHTVEKQNEHDSDQQKSQLNEKSNTHNHRWRGSVDGCSGLPGVICCLDRNARRFAAQHEGRLVSYLSVADRFQFPIFTTIFLLQG